MARHNNIGKLGEDIACKYLRKKGYSLVSRNFSAKTGEIDIITEYRGKIIFFEVKAVSCETINSSPTVRAEENLHDKKLKKLYKTIDVYLNKHGFKDKYWELKLLTVKIGLAEIKAKVEVINVL